MAAAQPPRFPVSAYALAALASSMRDTLLDAAYNGDLLILKSALARLVLLLGNGGSHPSPREAVEAARSDRGIWALSIAANNGQLEVCRYLVQVLRVDVDAADDEGRTPLFYAVVSQNTAVVKYLLDHGADPDKADADMLTPLHSAAGLGECEMIELLLGKGASVDLIADEIGTPLHLATKERQVGAMKTLLDHNADCNKTYMTFGLYPTTPLFEAVNVSSVECVKLLVEAGAVINSDCVSTLSLDSTMGNDDSTECLNFLLEACANRDAADDDKDENTWKIALLKSFGSKAVQRKDYFSASAFYTKSPNGKA
uniref:Uncharacterized protein n=1 Tax=Avena sativa TaxID=4498 RepID=A0ACD5W8Y1_AVESA